MDRRSHKMNIGTMQAMKLAWGGCALLLSFAGHGQTYTNDFGVWSYAITNASATITGYAGSGGAVDVPGTIGGLPVTSIGNGAFENLNTLAIITIPASVTSIGADAFFNCTNLSSVTIGNGVTNIQQEAFDLCVNLNAVYFEGNAPGLGAEVFVLFGIFSEPTTVYYLPGTTGWSMFDSNSDLNPAVPWNPQAQTTDGSFGVQNDQFGFNLTGTSNLVIVVEACTNPANPVWSPVSTNTLINGTSYFSDPQWTNFPGRFYRFSSP